MTYVHRDLKKDTVTYFAVGSKVEIEDMTFKVKNETKSADIGLSVLMTGLKLLIH